MSVQIRMGLTLDVSAIKMIYLANHNRTLGVIDGLVRASKTCGTCATNNLALSPRSTHKHRHTRNVRKYIMWSIKCYRNYLTSSHY